MSMRMLVDAAHPEETRVVVTRGDRLEAFEYESSSKKQLKGNIYLAKVTRVEPSLQAAFVDYGGNRHGFLAFNEIHPDYYQIPVQDRQDLAEDTGAADDEEENPDADASAKNEEGIESVSGEDEIEEDIKRPARAYRQYKIQEVIKRRQILLIQVVKEERGTKGAALTTYLSLAGRYCVLMPNTARGGGISRKIVNPADRKRLKSIAGNLTVPEGMGVIIRTAGLKRTKPEIKRDYEYLLRTWNTVRELTLESTAPCLVHEEGDLIRRGIRDLYNKEITEILVSGDEAYRAAKNFMKTLMPSQSKVVQPYRDSIPLFHKYKVEQEIGDMFSPRVTLKSGAYIIINPTEALVAIDVNSGRATKERNIEETAYRTNLEAAAEIARQVRLRDLAGLVVIDFIDMENSKNVRAVEAKMKECLKADRARIQVGRISSFGLMEMSRQRLRPDLMEASTNACQACGGTGVVRSTESTALAILRSVEDEGMREPGASITVDAPPTVAIYILNQKRAALREIEERYNFEVEVRIDNDLVAPEHTIERRKAKEGDDKGQDAEDAKPSRPAAKQEADSGKGETSSGSRRRRRSRRRQQARRNDDSPPEAKEISDNSDSPEETASVSEGGGQTADAKSEAGDEEKPGPRRQRRSRRGGRGRTRGKSGSDSENQDKSDTDVSASSESKAEPKAEVEADAGPAPEPADQPDAASETQTEGDGGEPAAKPTPRKRTTRARKPRSTGAKTTRSRSKKADDDKKKPTTKSDAPLQEEEESTGKATPAASSRSSNARKSVSEPEQQPATPLAAAPVAESATTEDPPAQKPKRRGWWQRK